MHAVSQTFRLMHPSRQSFRCLCPTGQTLQIYTRNKTNVSDWCTLQDKRFRFISPCQPFFFRFILPARQTFQISLSFRKNRFIYTPCKINFSDLYTQQDKRFRFIHPWRQTFQIDTRYKSNISDWYTLQDKPFGLMHPARQTLQIYTPCWITVS